MAIPSALLISSDRVEITRDDAPEKETTIIDVDQNAQTPEQHLPSLSRRLISCS